MTIEIKVPELPESVTDATVAEWHKQPGDSVKRDEKLVDLETDKIMLDVPAPEDGVLQDIVEKAGQVVEAGQLLAKIDTEKAQSEASQEASTSREKASESESEPSESTEQAKEPVSEHDKGSSQQQSASQEKPAISPSARRLLREHGLTHEEVQGTGKQGRILKEDVERVIQPQSKRTEPEASSKAESQSSKPSAASTETEGERPEQRVPMSRMRARIAERLMDVKQNTAMLTTFNEINMQPVMAIREQYKSLFQQKHDVKLGFMSFFVKAAVEALKRYPVMNASIDGTDIIYHGYFDIGIAVSTEKGLVVPVLKDADQQDMAGIEKKIIDFGERAQQGKLELKEMQGGTFSITNGGVFGSMLSTPILNPPQSAILGMHKIEKRPMVENDEVVIRPMMYLALSYDHRLVDGRDAVSFLVTIKQLLEEPSRLLLNI